jgi:hypothetical protein
MTTVVLGLLPPGLLSLRSASEFNPRALTPGSVLCFNQEMPLSLFQMQLHLFLSNILSPPCPLVQKAKTLSTMHDIDAAFDWTSFLTVSGLAHLVG